ncbi:hypothetical protein [Rheinheimera soli]|uniref:Immunity protein 53 n=1 Tax=Rheinheimera soli TaxID=443616 RepID=A0ABU1W5J6_9GAMM|nr:hypothetical protein [Rheinheimera soli]MDR7123100.1 hypothetical protein [Rheinheimera soli]
MITKHMKPIGGWENFELHDDLGSFLWKELKLRENNEGEWAYMSFTSFSSIWELVVNAELLATIILECGEDEKVHLLTISVIRDDLLSSDYFKPIIDTLINDFNINFV